MTEVDTSLSNELKLGFPKQEKELLFESSTYTEYGTNPPSGEIFATLPMRDRHMIGLCCGDNDHQKSVHRATMIYHATAVEAECHIFEAAVC